MKPGDDISKRGFRLGAAAILLLALALRLTGARGDLGQDEVTSLTLATSVTRLDQIFWKINFDNNHYLNSVWLFLVGKHASFFAIRAFSIALGVAGTAAIGIWASSRSRIASLVAMLLFATSYLMVNYQSEARGYAGLTLCTILAAMALENNRRWRLALCVFIGTLFHFDMVMVSFVLALTCFWLAWRQTGRIAAAFDITVATFLPAGFLTILALLPVLLTHYVFGHIDRFNVLDLLGGQNLAMQTAINILGLTFRYTDLALAALIATLWFVRHPADFKSSFVFCAIVALPLALIVAHVRNMDTARHFIVSGIAYILLAALIAGTVWQRNRTIVCVGLIAILIGNGILLKKFLAMGRGHYSQAVAALAKDGPTTYTMEEFQLAGMVAFYSQKLGVTPPTFIRWTECSQPVPQHFIVPWWGDQSPGDAVDWGPEGCRAHYVKQENYPGWGITGANWMLFQLQ